MLSLQTLTNIESLLMSRSHPMWGEFMPLAQTISEVQQAKAALTQSRVQPAPTSANPNQPVATSQQAVPNGAALPAAYVPQTA
jgi:hypothetical protein